MKFRTIRTAFLTASMVAFCFASAIADQASDQRQNDDDMRAYNATKAAKGAICAPMNAAIPLMGTTPSQDKVDALAFTALRCVHAIQEETKNTRPTIVPREVLLVSCRLDRKFAKPDLYTQKVSCAEYPR